MTLTRVPGSLIKDDAITSAKITDATITSDDFSNTTITSAKMAVDPRNASNLNSGSVPAARLSNVPAADLTGLQNNIATVALHSAVANNLAAYNLANSFIDQYEDSTGLDVLTDVIRNTSGEYMASLVSTNESFNPWAHGTVAHGSYVSLSNSDTRGTFTANDSPLVVAWENAGNSTGVYTVVWTLVQVAGGGGPNNWPMIAKNSYADWADSSGYANSYGAYFGGWNKNSSVGWKVKFVYDTSDEDVLLAYSDTGSGYGSPETITYGANWASTTLSTLYWATASWDDGGSPNWIVDFTSGTRVYDAVNATGNYTSSTETAAATVSKMSIVVLYKNAYGTATLDTDLVAQVSADGGSNYVSAPLTAAGTFSTGVLIAKSNDITISNTGTAPKYKISFANQAAASKETQVYGVSMIY